MQKAHVLSLNEFNMPKVFSESDSAYVHIIYLLLLEPGTFQSHPNMGVGLRSRYRYNNNENFLLDLKNSITDQISTYLPELTFVDISLTVSNTTLGIIIDTTNGAYVLAYDSEKDVMDASASYVLDQL